MVIYHSFLTLKASVKLEQLISYCGLKMTREGENYRGPCPFCKRGGDRALFFNTKKQLYFCHGRCQEGGDIITFIAKSNGTSLEEAAETLWLDFHIGR